MSASKNSLPFVNRRILNLVLASIYMFASLLFVIAFCDASFLEQKEASDRIVKTWATLNEEGTEIYINIKTASNHHFTTFERPGYEGDKIILEQSPLLNIITSVSRKGRLTSISHKTIFKSILIYVFSFFSIYLVFIGVSIFKNDGKLSNEGFPLYCYGPIALLLISIAMIYYFM